FTADRVVSQLRMLLDDDQARAQMQSNLRQVGDTLRGEQNAIARVAQVTCQFLRPSPETSLSQVL
ncbi:MAG: hypothetical protein WB974_13105, partial [Acidobacteriaceae bacterium]